MKKKFFLFFAVLTILLTACSSSYEEVSDNVSTENELIFYGQKFAKVHNECLDYIYESACNLQTRASNRDSIQLTDVIINATNEFVARKCANTRSVFDDTTYVTKEMYDTITIEDIKKQMSPKELEYTNKAIENIHSTESLLKDVAYDPELSDIQKQAVICFLTTLKVSLEYWRENINKWKNSNNVESQTRGHFRFDWKEVAFADAYWGYTGMLSSGMNVYVGGGTAALGSAFACLK
ncbi:MAG: hypothetical protein J1E57_03160 [Prevotella sp.]|nr:hypothetical protein [Prevotella sp.]